ncbi:MAG: hypothetical protein HFF11_04090 [Angelakisella sp.]|nr:hypothetical protein [Angelakisella sp.]
MSSILLLAKQIRLRLGPKGYLLDSYLDLVLQGLNIGITSETAEIGTQAAYQLQLTLLSNIVNGREPKMPHPLCDWVQKIYEQHPEIHAYQESRTRMYLLMGLAEEELLKYVLSEFMAKQETVRIGSGDIVSLNELYERISGYVEESLLEELNQRLLRRFQLTPVLSAFIQGFADDLLFQLTWRDPESSKQIFQILLDVLPGEA